jgi:excisionase family DNA binding protein
MTNSTQVSPVMTVDEAAQLLRISRQSAYQGARRGEIPTVRIGRRLLVPRVRLAELLGETGGEASEKTGGLDAAP